MSCCFFRLYPFFQASISVSTITEGFVKIWGSARALMDIRMMSFQGGSLTFEYVSSLSCRRYGCCCFLSFFSQLLLLLLLMLLSSKSLLPLPISAHTRNGSHPIVFWSPRVANFNKVNGTVRLSPWILNSPRRGCCFCCCRAGSASFYSRRQAQQCFGVGQVIHILPPFAFEKECFGNVMMSLLIAS